MGVLAHLFHNDNIQLSIISLSLKVDEIGVASISKFFVNKNTINFFNMNSECSMCLESFSSISDVSVTHCGHLYHTDCIKKWFQNEKKFCPQCKKVTTQDQIIKIYFSVSQSKNDLINELVEANR